MLALMSLGFTLSLDNFRTSIVLGGLKPTLLRSIKTSAIFGLWDGVAPLVGILVGDFLSDKISSTADIIAAIGLGAYGLFVVVRALLSDPSMRIRTCEFATRGLPLPLSVDNVAAGASARPRLATRPGSRPPVRDDHVLHVGRRASDRPHWRPTSYPASAPTC